MSEASKCFSEVSVVSTPPCLSSLLLAPLIAYSVWVWYEMWDVTSRALILSDAISSGTNDDQLLAIRTPSFRSLQSLVNPVVYPMVVGKNSAIGVFSSQELYMMAVHLAAFATILWSILVRRVLQYIHVRLRCFGLKRDFLTYRNVSFVWKRNWRRRWIYYNLENKRWQTSLRLCY